MKIHPAHASKIVALLCVIPGMARATEAQERKLSPLEKGLLTTLSGCAAGGTVGYFVGRADKDAEVTGSIGLNGLMGCVAGGAFSWWLYGDEGSKLSAEIENLQAANRTLENRLKDAQTKGGEAEKVSREFNPYQVIPEFNESKSLTTVDLSECKNPGYRFTISQDALAERSDVLPANKIPEIVLDQQMSVEIRVRYLEDKCLKPNLRNGKFLSHEWPRFGLELRKTLLKTVEEYKSRSQPDSQKEQGK